MSRIYIILFFLIGLIGQSQTITVDDTSNSASDLVSVLLGNSCMEVSNISISSPQSVAYFNRNGSSFPITEGVILRSGTATHTQGSYTGNNLSGTASGGGSDTFLQNLSNTSSGTSTPLLDLAFLEFDFVPVSSAFSFNFLFASNEYGQYQCLSNDIFAFELTNLSTGVTTNLAVVPGTANPVSVKNIKNAAYNNTCGSTNPNLFSVYNVNNPAASTLNMRGHTVVLNAFSTVTPNTAYRLKLVIADYGDADVDSAVFIAAGSFQNAFNLGNDRIICTGDESLLDTNLDNSYTYEWLMNGNPTGITTPTYTVTQPGTYTVNITKGTCFLTDTVVFNDLLVTNPVNLQTCNTGSASYSFNLSTNDEASLAIDDSVFDVFYYASLADVASDNPIPAGNLSNYASPGAETIYIKIFNTETNQFCDAVYPFDLIVTSPVNSAPDFTTSICDSNFGQTFDLSNLNNGILLGQPASNFNITFYSSLTDAQQASNSIGTILNIPAGTTSINVWALVQDITNPNCSDITGITFNINPLPLVSSHPIVVECSSYTLPTIANGTYYNGQNGTGTQYNPGDVIDESGTYYIFSGPDANGCTNQTSFEAYFIEEYEPSFDHCGTFSIPAPPYGIGAFYTAAGGPSGGGTLLPTGTEFTNTTQATITQNIFYYAEMNDVPCIDIMFTINIHPIPLVDDPADVITCDSYTLPALTNGTYYYIDSSSGVPQQVFVSPGYVVSQTQTIYAYNQIISTDYYGNPWYCTAENPFVVNIIDTNLFTPQQACGSYTLPPVTVGGYFDAPNGGGNPIDPAEPITSSQTVYYHAPTTSFPNCTEIMNLHFEITIHPLPLVDTIPSGTHCGEFILPTLNNGTYYTLQGGPGVIGQTAIPAGSLIDLSGINLAPGTYWIYNGPDTNFCFNESSFTIGITPYPVTDDPINRIECQPYTISTPINGTVYTAPNGPNGSGTVVNASDTFSSDNLFYMYNIDPATGCVFDKPFQVYYNGINLPDFDDIAACDSYTLPVLTHVPPESSDNYNIGYFYEPNGVNPVPNGTIFTSSNTPDTIYVYAVNAGRFGITCIEEKSFTITVSDTPVLPTMTFPSDKCGSYTLPALPPVSYNIGYYSSPGGVGLISPANYTFSNAGDYTVYVYATAPNNPNCNDELSFNFTVYPLLNLTLTGGIICVDPITNTAQTTHTVNTGLNPSQFDAEWYLNGTLMGTGLSYTASQAGTYTVDFIKLTPESGADCNYESTTVTIEQSSVAVASYTLSGAFEDVIDITVNIDAGYGEYLYQLEDGPLQTSNVFSNVLAGEYTISIYDTKANCGKIELTVNVLSYPNFFTPNNDGINDFWNIQSLADQPDSYINIYDRYGKLLKQISPSGKGWDGKYNGEMLPSTDYWFQVFYKLNGEPREFKAHFSMKR
ncbi:choice-of-anchor L domain-containing protein [Flavobacterium sp.]|uniref:T9SS type B sorting domain-containing protein n=1 Tax=Flavobacterium sp. TaxID=239 RepID=UPI0028BDD623|nr:choice-of-anchor L domain-containing protein [Flavobacterium sp.]